MVSAKRYLPVQLAVEWAFRNEHAQLDLPDTRDYAERGFGFGMEYVLIQRAKLGGVQIDQSRGTSSPHEDAEAIAAAVLHVPTQLGGYRMAINLAEMGRTGITPDWMPGAVPRLVPVAWKAPNQTGGLAVSEVIGAYLEPFQVPHPKNPKRMITRRRRVEIHYTPCRWDPHPAEIEAWRGRYTAWWTALDDLRSRLQAGRTMRTIAITDDMPPQRPWARRTSRSSGGLMPSSSIHSMARAAAGFGPCTPSRPGSSHRRIVRSLTPRT